MGARGPVREEDAASVHGNTMNMQAGDTWHHHVDGVRRALADGKLTTRIGRNSDDVRTVLRALVHFGEACHRYWYTCCFTCCYRHCYRYCNKCCYRYCYRSE